MNKWIIPAAIVFTLSASADAQTAAQLKKYRKYTVDDVLAMSVLDHLTDMQRVRLDRVKNDAPKTARLLADFHMEAHQAIPFAASATDPRIDAYRTTLLKVRLDLIDCAWELEIAHKRKHP